MLAEPLLLLHTPTHAAAHNTTTMPCAAGELCQLRNSTTTPEFSCCGPCGGRLHRICGDLDDDELELAGTENVESEGGRRLAPPPPFSELSSLFGPLEKYAESCGIS